MISDWKCGFKLRGMRGLARKTRNNDREFSPEHIERACIIEFRKGGTIERR